ncbi:MAG: hypothetical protein Q7V20_11465 [Aquabacterium sp.]|uniref:hypothetical protein n=1 Tax=Aquabacterium sp. TaxID=1872578 RepID=UPI00271C9515|nr:hypothetical protein [Aquabacterium sp.]MDO9004063.1 hypothetical protein [Aquabacterium sp.]
MPASISLALAHGLNSPAKGLNPPFAAGEVQLVGPQPHAQQWVSACRIDNPGGPFMAELVALNREQHDIGFADPVSRGRGNQHHGVKLIERRPAIHDVILLAEQGSNP